MIAPIDDVARIMAVMEAAFPPEFGEAWTRRQVEDAFVFGACHYALIDADGAEPPPDRAAAGFYLSRHLAGEEELLLLAVVPQARRRGVGQRLLDRFAHDARERGAYRLLLEMREGNPAEHLYRLNGFESVGRRNKYYRCRNGERIDAITFARTLQPK